MRSRPETTLAWVSGPSETGYGKASHDAAFLSEDGQTGFDLGEDSLDMTMRWNVKITPMHSLSYIYELRISLSKKKRCKAAWIKYSVKPIKKETAKVYGYTNVYYVSALCRLKY